MAWLAIPPPSAPGLPDPQCLRVMPPPSSTRKPVRSIQITQTSRASSLGLVGERLRDASGEDQVALLEASTATHAFSLTQKAVASCRVKDSRAFGYGLDG